MITLIIVDCQNDFISGTMSTKGAKNVLPEIKKFIKKYQEEIDKILDNKEKEMSKNCRLASL